MDGTEAANALLRVSSPALETKWEAGSEDFSERYGKPGRGLGEFLSRKNGFYAFESALHLFPFSPATLDSSPTLMEWNEADRWRFEYGDLIAEGTLFFAEDATGDQFAMTKEGISHFSAETGELEWMGVDFDAWLKLVMEEWRDYSRYEMAHNFQAVRGPLRAGERILPKIPFVVGGPQGLANLYAGDAASAMRFRGSLANQIRDLPDGAPVKIHITGGPESPS